MEASGIETLPRIEVIVALLSCRMGLRQRIIQHSLFASYLIADNTSNGVRIAEAQDIGLLALDRLHLRDGLEALALKAGQKIAWVGRRRAQEFFFIKLPFPSHMFVKSVLPWRFSRIPLSARRICHSAFLFNNIMTLYP